MSYYTEKLAQVSKDDLQMEAYNTEDSTVVIAGPGSGKTTILTLKIMKLLNGYIPEPQGLACLTFSREAAREFEDRLKKLGYVKRRNVFLGTVHSFCISEVLGRFAALYDCNISLPIKIIPQKLKKQLFKEVKRDLEIDRLAMSAMDKQRTLQISGSSKVEVEDNAVAKRVADEYEKRLLDSGYVDYESIIILSTKLIQEQKYVRDCLSARYPWLVIDEYQDLGRPLHEMVLSLFNQTDIKIFAVGDPDQSIYSFSGAIPNYLMELYDRDDIIPIKLINNYRSNQYIVDGSETVLEIKRDYHAMTREDEGAEYHFITCKNGLEDQYKYFVDVIVPKCMEKGIALEEIAVLLSKNDECKELADECMKRDIPYYISRHEFERTDFVKWLEECAVWINDKTQCSFGELFDYWKSLLLMHNEKNFYSEKEELQEKEKFLQILTSGEDCKNSLKMWINYMCDALDIKNLLQGSEQMPDELDNLANLLKEVSDEKYENYDTTKFAKLGKPENQITLSTRHSSKGLEFQVVVMMGMEEEHFPTWRATRDAKEMEENNRICFVCVSRARSVCILMRSTNYIEENIHGKVFHKVYQPSRYWNELYQNYGKHE